MRSGNKFGDFGDISRLLAVFVPTETSSETPNLGPENSLNKGCLRAGSQGGLSLSQSLPALDMLDPSDWKCGNEAPNSTQISPKSFIEFVPNQSWYNGHRHRHHHHHHHHPLRFTNPPTDTSNSGHLHFAISGVNAIFPALKQPFLCDPWNHRRFAHFQAGGILFSCQWYHYITVSTLYSL